MMKNNLMYDFTTDKENAVVYVKREFAADKPTVWNAWTNPEILDLWWAPKPWKAETKHMDFKVGGHWLYAMVGPEGEKHWARADYQKIDKPNVYEGLDAFCDEEGNYNPDFGRSHWTVSFQDQGDKTLVDITLKFESLKNLEQHIEMGFKEGFSMAMENLDAIFAK